MTVICHIIAGLRSGGAERMLSRVATRPRQGDRHVVVSLLDEGAYGAFLRDAGVELHCLRIKSRFPSPRAITRLTKLLRTLRPDVVMTWLYPADLLGTLCAGMAGLGAARVVWNIRCSNFEPTREPIVDRLVRRALAWLSPRPFAVAVNSHAGRKHHEALGYRPRAWWYLPNGVDTDVWRPCAKTRQAVRRELGISDHELVCGLVARVDPQKDHANFLAAAEHVASVRRDVRFLLVGEGTQGLVLPPDLQGRVIALGKQEHVSRLMNVLDVSVLSSAYGEGFPNVVCEAMATEVPCIVTDVGDAARLVEGAGMSVPPRDATALAGAMLGLLDMPRDERRALGRAARLKVIENYTIEIACQAYSDLCRAVASAGNPQAQDDRP